MAKFIAACGDVLIVEAKFSNQEKIRLTVGADGKCEQAKCLSCDNKWDEKEYLNVEELSEERLVYVCYPIRKEE